LLRHHPYRPSGVDSYILKTTSASDIAEAIRKTYNNESVFEAEVVIFNITRKHDNFNIWQVFFNLFSCFDTIHIVHKFVMLTSYIEDNEVYRALDSGVDSYILKTTSASDITPESSAR
jgi:DNA-binding NarL/FixJ family response regulator